MINVAEKNVKPAERQKRRTFLELSELERIEALTSGASNSCGKALILWVMKPGREYTCGKLNGAAEAFLGRGLPFKYAGRLLQYCKQSLEPAGFVTEGRVAGEGACSGKFLTAYAVTEDADKYGKPAVARFMQLASITGISLNMINGFTASTAGIRHAYFVARTLECLSDGEKRTTSAIAEQIGANPSTIARTLKHLHEIGFVNYKSVSTDHYGDSERDFSVILLKDPERLRIYKTDIAKLKEDATKIQPTFRYLRCLMDVLNLEVQELNRNLVAKRLGISEKGATKIISILVGLGVYSYRNLSSKAKSEAEINERGLLAYELAYGPIINVARNPLSKYVFEDYRKPLETEGMHALFLEELQRFRETSNNLGHMPFSKTVGAILTIIRGSGPECFRARNIRSMLEQVGERRKLEPLAQRVLGCLRRERQIEATERRGYYSLVRNAKPQLYSPSGPNLNIISA